MGGCKFCPFDWLSQRLVLKLSIVLCRNANSWIKAYSVVEYKNACWSLTCVQCLPLCCALVVDLDLVICFVHNISGVVCWSMSVRLFPILRRANVICLAQKRCAKFWPGENSSGFSFFGNLPGETLQKKNN